MSSGHTLGALAARFGLAVHGDVDTLITGVATLSRASASQLTFLANRLYRKQLPATGAAAVVLAEADRAGAPCPVLVSRNPYADFARIAALYEPPVPLAVGIHPSAVVDPAADVAPGASIGALAVVGPRTRIEEGAVVGAGSVIGEDCVVGTGSILVARVTLVRRVVLGRRVLVHPGAVLGADGFGLAFDQGQWLKVPQLGGVRIGDDCEIGANTTIDRGALEDTVLEDDVRLDNQIQIGHGVHVGAHTAMAGCVAIAGSTRIGRNCLIGGAAGIVGHLEICDRVTITAMSLVTHSIRQPGEYSSGLPAEASASWRRNAARFRRLDALARRINTLAQEPDDHD